MDKYKEINYGEWDSFGKMLLSKKGSDQQKKFLQSCINGKDDFLLYLDNNLLNKVNAFSNGKGVFIPFTLTEAEFRFPPIDTQKEIWGAFEHVPKQYTSSCGFWGSIIIDMIKNNCITPEHLASNVNGVNETGVYMLDSALTSDDSKELDDCVRRVLRSMGNPAPRGKRIIFNDFYLGRAYWRWNWSNKMSNKINLTVEEILSTLDEKGYAVFAAAMHSGRSYISQTNTLGGLLLFLNKNPSTLVKDIKKIVNTISYLSIWKAIEIQPPELNHVEIEKIASSLEQ